jgi:hypothetical protein
MSRRGSTPERAILAELMAPRPSGELVALDSVRFEASREAPEGRLVDVRYRARHPQQRLPPAELEHRATYEVAQTTDGRWEATLLR